MRAISCVVAPLVLPVLLAAQSPDTVRAVRTPAPIVLDGRDDDAVWRQIVPTGGFREVRPREGDQPDQRTDFRVAYDPANLYIFVRLYDTHPDSIRGLLTRRDERSASDHVTVMLDPYHDRRTGFEFLVNPAGVKSDFAIYNDGEEDVAWDAVWDVATRVDSLGWTAEYRIPFSQLKFAPTDDVTFGILIWRNLQRETAEASWPLMHQSRTGFVSQFADLVGLRGLEPPRRLELTPYLLTQNEPRVGGGAGPRHQAFSAGGDLLYRVTSNFALNATVNPDFGQVEADPAELNLSAFETFFDERRPFFVADAGLFDFRVNCFAVLDCDTGERLVYSRRIGRSPSLAGVNGDATTPTATRILGAAKLTGRTANGMSIGVLEAVTDRVAGRDALTAEPAANHAVLRINRDFRGGATSVGAMATAVNRALDPSSAPYLHESAYTGGIDLRHRLGNYELAGSLMASRVAGSADAIARTQRAPAHYLQRPDDGLRYDPDRTSLTGGSGEIRFGKVGGSHTRFETGYARRSAGFEINDLGFMNQAADQSWTNWFHVRSRTPNGVSRQFNWNLNWWQFWSLDGLPTERAFNTNIHTELVNRMWFHLGATQTVGDVYCDRGCTRGGPALRVGPTLAPWAGLEGDDRHAVVPSIWVNYRRQDEGHSTSLNINPQVRIKAGTRLSTSLGVVFDHTRTDAQWFGNPIDASGVTHYTFAALDQHTAGLTWRLNYTFTPAMSLQWYANLFLSRGSYSRVRELADPRAKRRDDRFKPYLDQADDPGGFNVQAFRANAVFRWEYLPGSTLFVVWSQGRAADHAAHGTGSFVDDFSDLLSRPAEDRFLVKVSYWINR